MTTLNELFQNQRIKTSMSQQPQPEQSKNNPLKVKQLSPLLQLQIRRKIKTLQDESPSDLRQQTSLLLKRAR